MLTKVNIPGFPKEIGNEIEMPNIAELMLYPFFLDASLDDMYKYGTDFQRKLLYAAPLKSDKKYLSVTSHVQLLSPGDRAVWNKIGYDLEWHIDNHEFYPFIDRFHILMSDCSALTEFNITETSVEVDDKISQLELNSYYNDNQDIINLKPKKVPPNRFTTFGRHVHRAINPEQHEFRYYIRIIESDHKEPIAREQSLRYYSAVQRGRESVRNIIHNPDSIVINAVKPYKFR